MHFKEYFVFLELGLDELELSQILDELEKESLEDWKIEPFIRHLTKSDIFDETFKNSRALKVLERYPKEIVDGIDKICGISNKTELHFLLILAILKICDLNKVKAVFNQEIFTPYIEMKSKEIFEQDLRTFLNKTVLTNKRDYEQDWFILG